MLITLFGIIATAIVALISPFRSKAWLAYLFAAIHFGALSFFVSTIPEVGGLGIHKTVGGVPFLGMQWAFHLDGLALVFCLLITGIGTGVFLYSAAYMKTYRELRGFFPILLLFSGAMLGVVLSDNLVCLFVFWELTSVCSFLLIGFKNEKEEARAAARKAFLITGSGGLFLLVALVLLSLIAQQAGLSPVDSMSISALKNVPFAESGLYVWAFLFFTIGVATKSAQFPFHIWLPAAMAGPTPVSSYLHSATMVKAGVYLLMRFFPLLGSTPLWSPVFALLGTTTMLLGAFMALSHRDIKKMLAYSTISVLGTLTTLVGFGTELSIEAATVFVVAHALYKASLFQVAGNIDYAAGSRDIKLLSGLGPLIPATAAAALLASLSMAGAPPLFGFFGKELTYMAKVGAGHWGPVFTTVSVFANILTVGVAIAICYRPFKKNPNLPVPSIQVPPFLMRLSPLFFALVGFLVGIFPKFFDQHLGSPMASAILGAPVVMKLKLWHGLNTEALLVLGLSIITLVCGLVVATRIKPVIRKFTPIREFLESVGPSSHYELGLQVIQSASSFLLRIFQGGNLTNYLRMALWGGFAVLLVPVLQSASYSEHLPDLLSVVVALLVVVPIVASLARNNPAYQLIFIGTGGFGLILIYGIYGAIDLGMTQALVESLSLIFLIFVARAIGKFEPKRRPFLRLHDIALVGFSIFFLAALMDFEPDRFSPSAANFFATNSLEKAFGHNIVNVILVDFRALDTLGEVLVIACAMIGIGYLLSRPMRRQHV